MKPSTVNGGYITEHNQSEHAVDSLKLENLSLDASTSTSLPLFEQGIELWNKFQFQEAEKKFAKDLSPESCLYLIWGRKLNLVFMNSIINAKAEKILSESKTEYFQQQASLLKTELSRLNVGLYLLETSSDAKVKSTAISVLSRSQAPFPNLVIGYTVMNALHRDLDKA